MLGSQISNTFRRAFTLRWSKQPRVSWAELRREPRNLPSGSNCVRSALIFACTTIENMDTYLLHLEEQATQAGRHVHWVSIAEDARQIVLKIARGHNARLAVRSNSMVLI